jgi:hypothetical protein
MSGGTETFLRVGIDGTSSVSGARVVQRSMEDVQVAAALTDKQVNSVNESIAKIGMNSQGIRTVKRDMDDVGKSATIAANSWKEFTAANMSNYMKMTGSHGAAMKAMGADWQQFKTQANVAMDSVNSSSERFSHMLTSIEDRLIRIGISTAVFMALGRSIGAVKDVTIETLKYLGLIETSTLGIASSFLVSGKFVDTTTNKVLTGQRAMQAGLSMSRDVIEQLKVANMQTIATLDQLIVAYQVTLPVAMARGFNKSMVMDFTLAMVQAAGAIGLPFDQMAEETRSLLTGTINPRTSRIATVLGLRNEDIAEYKGNAKGLFDFLMGRLEGFRIAGLESQKTWAGLWSNVKDIAKQGSGIAFEGLFVGIKAEMTHLMDSIVTINTETKKINWNPEFISSAKSMGESITSIFATFVTGSKFVWDNLAVITKLIEAYILYKATMIGVWIAQAALNTQMVQSIILAERVATGNASYISSAGSDTLRAKQALDIAAAKEVETGAILAEVNATKDSIIVDTASARIKAETLALDASITASQLAQAEANYANAVAKKNANMITISALTTEKASLVASEATIGTLAAQSVVEAELATAKARKGGLAAAELSAESRLTAARGVNTVVNQQSAAATLLLKQQESRLVDVNILASDTTVIHSVAQEAAIAAETAHEASLVKLTIAQRLYSVGAGIATAATTLFNSAIALVGGQIGVAVIGVTSLYWALYKLYNLQDTRQLALNKIAAGGEFTSLVQKELDANKQIAEIKKQRIKDELDARNATPEERERLAVELALEAHKKNSITYLAEEMKLREKIADLEKSTFKKYKDSKSDSSITVLAEAKAQLTNVQQMLSANARQQVIDTAKAEATRDSMQKYVPNKPKVEEDKYNHFFDAAKYAADLKKFAKSERDIKDAITKNDIQDMKDATKLEQAELQIRYDTHLISMQQFIDAKYALQQKESQHDIMALEAKAMTLQNEYDKVNSGSAYNGGVKPFGGRNAETKEEINQAHLFNEAVLERNGLLAQTTTAWGAVHAAESKTELDGLLATRASIKAKQEELNSVLALQKANDKMRGDINTFNASKVGVYAPTGEVIDPVAHELAMVQDAHDKKAQFLQDEMDAIKNAQAQKVAWGKEWIELEIAQSLKRQQLTNNDMQTIQASNAIRETDTRKMYDALAKQAQTTFPKITAFATIAHLMTKKYDDEKKKAGETDEQATARINKAKLNMTSDYVGGAAELMNNLASTMDTSSRSGFESAKALNMAGALMSTAAAIMSQLAGGDPYTAWARAAMAGALGAVQVAMIAGTSYGGGGSVSSVPTGSFGGGPNGLSQSSVGGAIGAPIQSVHDRQTQDTLQSIADNMKNASLAIGKVADGLTKIADLFKSGSFMSLASGAAPNIGTGVNTSNNKVDYAALAGFSKEALIGSMLGPYGLIAGAFVGTTIALWDATFGHGPKTTEQAGIQLGLSGSNVSNQSYSKWREAGGWFSSDNTGTDTSAGNPAFTKVMQTTIDQIISTIGRGSVAMGTSANFAQASMTPVQIATAGRKPEDVAKDLQTWLENASNELAKTVTGLKDFTFYGENAFDALVRLSTALQSTNDKLDLIGATLITSTLQGANSAYKLQELMGGADKFNTAIDNYFTSMFTDNEQKAMKAAQASKQVSVAFAEMNKSFVNDASVSIPKTKDEFKSLVDSMTTDFGNVTTMYTDSKGNLVTASDRAASLFAALMDISTAFATVQDQIKAVNDATKKFTDDLAVRAAKISGIDTTLMELRITQEAELKKAIEDGMDVQALRIVQEGEWAAAVAAATGVVSKSLKDIASAAKDAAMNMVDAQIAIANSMKTIMTGPLANLSPEAAYNQAQAQFASLQGKTDLASLKALPDAANALLTASKTYNASGQAYQTDLANVLSAMNSSIGGTGDPTLSGVESQLKVLQDIRTALTAGLLVTELGGTGPLAVLIGKWNDATAAQLAANQTDAAKQSFLSAQNYYNTDVGTYDSAVSSAKSGYIDGSMTQQAANQQISNAYAPLPAEQGKVNDLYNTATGLGVTGITQSALPSQYNFGVSDTDARMQSLAPAIRNTLEILREGGLYSPYKAEWDIGATYSDGNVVGSRDGKLDVLDFFGWVAIQNGSLKYSSLGLPAFANGGITDGPSIAGEGTYREAIIPLLDGRTVRARIDGAADNRGIEDRLDKVVKGLDAMERKLASIESKAVLVKANER